MATMRKASTAPAAPAAPAPIASAPPSPRNPLVQLLASRLGSIYSRHGGEDSKIRFKAEAETLCREFMPSGGGFDAGTTLDFDASNSRKLVFNTSFHHMDDCGGYVAWTHHSVIVTPEFSGFHIRITGRDRNAIKDYIGDTFHSALSQLIESKWDKETAYMSFRLFSAN